MTEGLSNLTIEKFYNENGPYNGYGYIIYELYRLDITEQDRYKIIVGKKNNGIFTKISNYIWHERVEYAPTY